MRKYNVVLIESEVLSQIYLNLVESNDLKESTVIRYGKSKKQTARTQAVIMFNDGLKAANVSYYSSDYYFKDHANKGIVIIDNKEFKAIEPTLSEMVETAKKDLSIVEEQPKAVEIKNIFGVVNKKEEPKTVFAAKQAELIESEVIEATNTIKDGVISAKEYKRLQGLQRLSSEQKKSITIYEFLNM